STDVVVDHVTSTRWSSLEMFKSENEDLIQRLEQIAGVSSGIGGLLSTKSALIGGADEGTMTDASEADEVDTASSVDGASESTGSAPVANPTPRFAQGITLPRFTQRLPKPPAAVTDAATAAAGIVDLAYLVTSESRLADAEASERIRTKPAPRHFRHTSLPSAALLLSGSVPVQLTPSDDEPPPLARTTDSSTPTTQPTTSTPSATLGGDDSATPQPRSVVWADRCGWSLEVHHDYAEYLDRVITLRELRLHELMLRRSREEGAAAAGPAVWGGFGGSGFVFAPPPGTASASAGGGGYGRPVSGPGGAAGAAAVAAVSAGPPFPAAAAAPAASIAVSSATPPAHSGGLFSLLPSTTAPYSFG
ncbi:hypothetical protein HK405_010947, partial [Cladochytrium tenue]